MRINQHHKLSVPKLLTAVSVGAMLSACGGGDGSSSGGGTDVPGLDLPDKVSLIDAKSDGSSDGVAGDGLSGDAGSDYASDQARTYVYDPSMDALQTVNQILCYISQTGSSEKVNAGPYIALVDETKCEKESGNEGGGGQTAGEESQSNAPEYEQWVVDVTRANESAPQKARFWVPGDENPGDVMDGQTILADLTINSAPSAALPNGDFVLNFKGALDGSAVGMPGTEIAVMRGTLKSLTSSGDGSQLSFINESGTRLPGLSALGVDFSSVERANVVSGNAGSDSGKAVTSIEQSDGGGSRSMLYALDFNATGMQRGFDANENSALDSAELACLSRDDFDTFGWRYNLYHTGSGERVELNSGFPFSQVNGVNAMGYVGYWGVWVERAEALTHGDQITRRGDDGAAAQTYTVAISAGKLSKRSKGTVAFADLLGASLNWWGDVSDPQCNSGCNNSEQHAASIDASGTVTATHRWDDANGEYELVALDPVVDITPSNAGETLNLWSEALGGSVSYQQGSSTLTAYSEKTLTPDAAELSAGLALVCYNQCPVGGITSPSQSDNLYHGEGRFTYTLNSSAGVYQLIDDSNGEAVALTDTSGLGQAGEYSNVYAGPMVALADDPGLLNWWEIYAADTSYNWQSGPQDWNKTTAVIDANNELVHFDQPLQFFYTYSAGDDINLDPASADHPAGNAYRLSYGGQGDLWGFPYSPEDGCAGDDCPYYPAVTLADGVLLGTQGEYKVRLIEGEQRMREDAGACTSLDAAAVLADSALALPETVDAEVSFSISDRPDLSGEAPAVIAGVVQ